MRVLAGIGIIVLWAGLCFGGWLLVKDRPCLPAHDPAPALTADTAVYLDRNYSIETIPEFLQDAVIVRTFRHGAHPVHLRLDGPAVLWLLAVEGDLPDSWADAEPVSETVLCRGAQRDLTRVYRRILPAGDHVIEPLGPKKVASPLILVGSADIRQVETPAGLLRRAEHATRGYPRRMIATVPGVLLLLGFALVILIVARFRRNPRTGNDLPHPPA